MPQSVLIGAGVVILIAAAWYWGCLHSNQCRALNILRWLEGAIAKHGQISGVDWFDPAHFRARLQLSGGAFRQAALEVHLAPRHMPLRWAMWGWRGRQETLTFESNLTCPPRHSIEIGRTRCSGLTQRWMQNTGNWPTHTVATLFISNRPEWEPEVSGRMTSVVLTREFEFLEVSFRPRPPQFSVRFSLQETLQHPSGELAIFDCLRELAEGSPTSRM